MSFLHYREEDGYQSRLVCLLAELQRRLKVLNVVSDDVLTLFEDFGHFYEADGSYWARKFFFESRLREGETIFKGRHIVECFSERSPNRAKYYCSICS